MKTLLFEYGSERALHKSSRLWRTGPVPAMAFPAKVEKQRNPTLLLYRIPYQPFIKNYETSVCFLDMERAFLL
jgi:hypothetical protein